ncbi:hypothetical protein V491_00150 [Pseudogymnoascus sp. VKM F-3775]|nr:hypothetical protein V491_00150 [Pseudogymnoascus sp. VKM F-3775]
MRQLESTLESNQYQEQSPESGSDQHLQEEPVPVHTIDLSVAAHWLQCFEKESAVTASAKLFSKNQLTV